MTNLSKAKETAARLGDARSSSKERIAEIILGSKKVSEAAIEIEKSWSGSFAGYHAELYFDDFAQPGLNNLFSPEWGGVNGIPTGWKTRTAVEVKGRIEKLSKTSIDSLEEAVVSLTEEGKEVQREILTEFAWIESRGTESQRKLLKAIEDQKWPNHETEYVHSNTPKQFMSRDSQAMSQGIRLPAHLYYGAIAHDWKAKCGDFESLLTLGERLMRQIDDQVSSSPQTEIKGNQSVGLVTLLLDRFHLVVRQLLSRHDKRATLDVKDEYDVQDLLHTLLRVNFEDIRNEEWTPSYAGGSSRMDFLLKREEIVVEVKMTRSGLGAKELGEQLVVDIARYRSHPNCKTLICFVYDPAGITKNPRGLEADLEMLSQINPKVIAIIRP